MEDKDRLRARVEAELRDQGLPIPIDPEAMDRFAALWAPKMSEDGNGGWPRSSNSSQSWSSAGSLETAKNSESVRYRVSVLVS
jgi:hypothetical protein